jgi:hypothetical protein
MGLLDLHSTYTNIFAVHLKQSSFWPSADVKPMSTDLVDAKPWQCMLALHEYKLSISLISVSIKFHN